MDDIKKVLLITNAATDQEVAQVKEAFRQAQTRGLKLNLNLVHVIPNLPTCYFNIPSMVQLAEQYYNEAKECLNATGEALSVDKKDQWLITGRTKTEVLRLAIKLNAQFILASNASIEDLRKPLFSKEQQTAQVRNINSLVASNF